MQRLQGNARAVVFAGRMTKANQIENATRHDHILGSLKNFVPEDLLSSFKEWVEFPDGFDDETSLSLPGDNAMFSEGPMALQALDGRHPALGSSSPAKEQYTSPRGLAGRRRKLSRLGDKLTKQRVECPRHEQLKEMLPCLPPDPPRLSRAARRARAERAARQAELAHLEAERARCEALKGVWKARFRAIGFEVLRRLRQNDEEFLKAVKNSPVIPMTNKSGTEKGQRSSPSAGFDPFAQQLRPSRREPATPRRSAQRDELAARGNFNRNFVSDLAVKPRVDSQPLLACMEQDALEEREQISPGRLSNDAQQRAVEERAAPKSLPTGPTTVPKTHGSGIQRMLELLDPGCQIGFVDADAVIPLMFWLGLTKSRAAAMETLRMGFGSLQIENAALLVLGEHVDVQLRLVDGLRHLVCRDSPEHLCEYISSNSFQRLRAWFNSMRADPLGCVDTTQVQNLFARMEVTADRQTLFRLLSYMMENPHPSAALDPREAAAIESKKYSFNGFVSLICRCATSWVLHRVMSMLMSELPRGSLTDYDVSNRWIQLQRKIMISLLVNQRFWGRESRQVLSALQPPVSSEVEDLQELNSEQWNALFQRVRAQGLASVLPQSDGVPVHA